jgi:hypothetical protein
MAPRARFMRAPQGPATRVAGLDAPERSIWRRGSAPAPPQAVESAHRPTTLLRRDAGVVPAVITNAAGSVRALRASLDPEGQLKGDALVAGLVLSETFASRREVQRDQEC